MSKKTKSTRRKTKTDESSKETTKKRTTSKKTADSAKTTKTKTKAKTFSKKVTTEKKDDVKRKTTTTTKKKAETTEKTPVKKTKTTAKKTEAKKAAKKKATTKTKAKPKKKVESKKPKLLTREQIIKSRLFRLRLLKKQKQPSFRHEQAHRWVRVKESWRKVRGIDSATREKRKGRPAMVEAGYRKPKSVRGIHPSGYIEVLVHRPADLEKLDAKIHAVRIGATVGARKRQEIIAKAEGLMLRVLNAGAPETIGEEDLFTELEGIDMEVGRK